MDPTAPSEPRGPAARSSPRHARTVETHATAAAAAEAVAAEAAAAEAELLPDGLGPPACVALWGAVAAAGLKPALDKETEQQGALRWLERALDCAHLSARIKRHAQALLSSRRFTPNMAYMGLFGPLQSHCRASLLRLGGPLRRLYEEQGYAEALGAFSPALAAGLLQPLRQDDPLVGLAPPPSFDMTVFQRGESAYLHFLRLVASVVNDRFQTRVKEIAAAHSGEHKGCAIKGDVRMRNKALAEEDHRNETKPRPALNIDIVRCCLTFGSVGDLKNAVNALNSAFSSSRDGRSSGGFGRIKNGFSSSDAKASQAFHYHCFMVNIVVDFGMTFAELCRTDLAQQKIQAFLASPPETPAEPWPRWRKHRQAAVAWLKSPEMADRPVRMVCEVQALLRPYLEARKKMHLLYKVVRASDSVQLHNQFAVGGAASQRGRERRATWSEEEERSVKQAREEVEAGSTHALLSACSSGQSCCQRRSIKS